MPEPASGGNGRPFPQRRSSDVRLNGVVTDVAVLRNDMGYVRTQVDQMVEKLEKLASDAADPAATAGGRQLVKRLDDHEGRLDAHDDELDRFSTFRTEVLSFVRFSKALIAVLGAFSVLLSMLWTLHLWGWIR